MLAATGRPCYDRGGKPCFSSAVAGFRQGFKLALQSSNLTQSRKATRSMWLQGSTVKLKWPILKHAEKRNRAKGTL